LLSRQQQPRPGGDDRERITRAHQEAEALFRSKPPVGAPLAPESFDAGRPPIGAQTACPGNNLAGETGPSRGGPSTGQSRAAGDVPNSAVAIRAHPHLGQIRHEGYPSRRGLWGCRRRHRAHYPASLTGRFGRSTAAVGSPIRLVITRKKKAPWGGAWRFHGRQEQRGGWLNHPPQSGRVCSLLVTTRASRHGSHAGFST